MKNINEKSKKKKQENEINKNQIRENTENKMHQGFLIEGSQCSLTLSLDISDLHFFVEPIGQGSMATVSDGQSNSKILFDAGHGTPINKAEVTKFYKNKKNKYNDNFKNVEVVFLSHWDEDHFKMAAHPCFTKLQDVFWFFPFSKNALDINNLNASFKYEHRPLVWEMLLKVTEKNDSFCVIGHEAEGVVKINNECNVLFKCGKSDMDNNNRGVMYNLEYRRKGSDGVNVLIPGDANYSNFAEWIEQNPYTDLIASHHGSSNLVYDNVLTANNNKSKYVFSFGFDYGYKHPSCKVLKSAISKGYKVKFTSYPCWHKTNINDKLQSYSSCANRVRVI